MLGYKAQLLQRDMASITPKKKPFVLTPSGLSWEITAFPSTVLWVSVECSRPLVEPRGLDPSIPALSGKSVSSPTAKTTKNHALHWTESFILQITQTGCVTVQYWERHEYVNSYRRFFILHGSLTSCSVPGRRGLHCFSAATSTILFKVTSVPTISANGGWYSSRRVSENKH